MPVHMLESIQSIKYYKAIYQDQRDYANLVMHCGVLAPHASGIVTVILWFFFENFALALVGMTACGSSVFKVPILSARGNTKEADFSATSKPTPSIDVSEGASTERMREFPSSLVAIECSGTGSSAALVFIGAS